MIIISFNAFWKILRLENLVRKFLGLSFGPGIFLGVLIFAPICLIIPLTLDPNYPRPLENDHLSQYKGCNDSYSLRFDSISIIAFRIWLCECFLILVTYCIMYTTCNPKPLICQSNFRQSKTHFLKSSGFWFYNIITHWGHPGKGMRKSNQNRNVEAKNRESNWTVIIAINREFD